MPVCVQVQAQRVRVPPVCLRLQANMSSMFCCPTDSRVSTRLSADATAMLKHTQMRSNKRKASTQLSLSVSLFLCDGQKEKKINGKKINRWKVCCTHCMSKVSSCRSSVSFLSCPPRGLNRGPHGCTNHLS